jgi:tol-pal system protein YbgF
VRRYLPTLSGLVLCASPLFAVSLSAQEYIDLEQEQQRLPQERLPQGGLPQGRLPQGGLPQGRLPQPTQAEIEITEELPADQTRRSAALTESPQDQPLDAAEPDSGIGEMYYQMQLLQQEVMELRGLLEDQDYQMRQLKEQSLERYVDIDRRLSQEPAARTESAGAVANNTATLQEQAGEADAYREAYSLVRSQQFPEAVAAFTQFLQDYPAGKYAPNGHYWLGELYLVIQPPELESSRRQFTLLLEQYPDNTKIPDALYKLGKVYFGKGNREKAREYFDRVIREFGDSNSSAVKLARDFLSENY